MEIVVDPSRIDDYRVFLRAKRIPACSVVGNSISFPDEYAEAVLGVRESEVTKAGELPMPEGMFDYQADIARMAIRKRKFAGFIEPGLGKTWILLEFARHALAEMGGKRSVLIISPLMVIRQTKKEAERFYNTDNIPPIHVHIHDIDLTQAQHDIVRMQTGELFCTAAGGIMKRSMLGQIAKGNFRGKAVETAKPKYIRDLVETWRGKESTLIWCRYNAEQDNLAEMFPDAANIDGTTPFDEREELIEAFKEGEIRELISKPKILGFGLNLQRATRQVFSTCADSYEEYVQAVKRSNRIGSTMPLSVHLPITEIEREPMENVLRKAHMVQRDTEEQEKMFKQFASEFLPNWR